MAADLFLKMIDWDPKKRISAEDALKHPFLNTEFMDEEPTFIIIHDEEKDAAQNESQENQIKEEN